MFARIAGHLDATGKIEGQLPKETETMLVERFAESISWIAEAIGDLKETDPDGHERRVKVFVGTIEAAGKHESEFVVAKVSKRLPDVYEGLPELSTTLDEIAKDLRLRSSALSMGRSRE